MHLWIRLQGPVIAFTSSRIPADWARGRPAFVVVLEATAPNSNSKHGCTWNSSNNGKRMHQKPYSVEEGVHSTYCTAMLDCLTLQKLILISFSKMVFRLLTRVLVCIRIFLGVSSLGTNSLKERDLSFLSTRRLPWTGCPAEKGGRTSNLAACASPQKQKTKLCWWSAFVCNCT
jgi:hypothetical protein